MNWFTALLLTTSLVYRVAPTKLNMRREQLQAVELRNQLSAYPVVFSAAVKTGTVSVKCPTGFVVVGCSTAGLEYTQGTWITDDHKCATTVQARATIPGLVLARAICAPADEVGEIKYPHSDFYEYEFLTPSLSCGDGYSLLDCMLFTDFGDDYHLKDFPKPVVRGNSCNGNRQCHPDSLCYTYAICQKTLDGLSGLSDETVVFSIGMTNREAFAECPTDLVLVGCSSTGLGYSAGTWISYGRCATRANTIAAEQGVAVMARAVCRPASEVGDIQYVVSSDFVNSPAVNCSDGYSIIECMVYTEYGDNYKGEMFPQGVVRDNSCVSDRRCERWGFCQTHAICQKNGGLSEDDRDKVVFSALTTMGNTFAECPTDFVLLACISSGFTHSCGTWISSTGSCATCAINEGFGVMARATCGPAAEVGDIQYVQSDWSVHPELTCAAGYSMIDCMLVVEKGTMYAHEAFPQAVQGAVEFEACESDRWCRSDSLCRTHAICQQV